MKAKLGEGGRGKHSVVRKQCLRSELAREAKVQKCKARQGKAANISEIVVFVVKDRAGVGPV